MTQFDLPISAARALARELTAAKDRTRQARSSPDKTHGSLVSAEQAEAEVLARVQAYNEERRAEKAEREAVKALAGRKSKKQPKPPRPLVPCPICGAEVAPSKSGSVPAHIEKGAWCRGGSRRKKPRSSSPYLSRSVSVRTVSGGSPGLGKRA